MFRDLESIFTKNFKNTILFYDENKTITLDDFKNDMCNFLNETKLIEDKTVCLYIPNNCYLFYVSFFALIFSNKDIVLLSSINEDIINNLISTSKTFVSTEAINLKNLEIKIIPPKAYYAKKDIDNNVFINTFDNLSKRTISFFTSGSTSTPKCINKTLSSLLVEVKMHSDSLSKILESNPIVISTIVPFHMYGMLWRFLFSFCNLLRQDLSTIFYPEELEHKQNIYEKLIFISTPSFMDRISSYTSLYNFKDNIVKIFSSGNLLKNETCSLINKTFNTEVYEIYGSTETGGIAYRNQRIDEYFHVFSEVKIKLNEDSSLNIESPFCVENPFKINDGVTLINDRTFLLNGRIDRIVKISDKRLSLPEMEEKFSKCQYIKECYLVKLFDNKREVLGAIFVLTDLGKEFVIKNGKKKLYIEIKKYINNFYDVSFFPRKFRILERIPKNSQGKILKDKIMELFKSKVSEPITFITTLTKDYFEADLVFLDSASYFEGHFPIFPILPGVMGLHFVFKYLSDYFSVSYSKCVISKLKYTNIISPNMRVCLKIKKVFDNEFIFEYTNNKETQYSSGKIIINE